ncbi:MAG: aspartate/glutamate racemase family protein [Armatimonadota bacterium]|nr:aspartate/glutamate racemase family protein [Armatimonadota bacterium]
MRIWYQSFGDLDHMGGYPPALRAHLARVAGPDVSVEVGGIDPPTVAAKYVRLVQTADAVAVVRSALAAQERGVDAVVIGNIFDPGLYEARQLLRIPVVGLGEAGLLVGKFLAGRLAVVCSSRLALPRIRENVYRYGLTMEHVAFYALETTIPAMAAAFGDVQARRDILRHVTAVSRQARSDGCELLLLGSGILNVLAHLEPWDEDLALPILDVSAVAIHCAGALVRLYTYAGVGPSRIGTFAQPSPDILERLAQAYNLPHLRTVCLE